MEYLLSLPCESNNLQNNIQYHTTHIHKTVTTYTYTIITKKIKTTLYNNQN